MPCLGAAATRKRRHARGKDSLLVRAPRAGAPAGRLPPAPVTCGTGCAPPSCRRRHRRGSPRPRGGRHACPIRPAARDRRATRATAVAMRPVGDSANRCCQVAPRGDAGQAPRVRVEAPRLSLAVLPLASFRRRHARSRPQAPTRHAAEPRHARHRRSLRLHAVVLRLQAVGLELRSWVFRERDRAPRTANRSIWINASMRGPRGARAHRLRADRSRHRDPAWHGPSKRPWQASTRAARSPRSSRA